MNTHLSEESLRLTMAKMYNGELLLPIGVWFSFNGLGWPTGFRYPGLAYRLACGAEQVPPTGRHSEIGLAVVGGVPEYIIVRDRCRTECHSIPEHIETWDEAMRYAETILKLEQ